MELKQINKKIKCDVPGCKHIAEYGFVFKKSFLPGNFYLCKECLNEMYSAMGKHVVPQAIEHVYKKSSKGSKK